MASAALSGVTVRHVISRCTGAAGSPNSRPTLSHAAARLRGAKVSRNVLTSAMVGMVIKLTLSSSLFVQIQIRFARNQSEHFTHLLEADAQQKIRIAAIALGTQDK